MKTDDAPEIIEILDDDASAFSEAPASGALDDSGGPRWVGPVAAAALVAVIAYGVASSASSSGTPEVTPASSTTAGTPTTRPAPAPTVAAAAPVPYYAAEPPRQYKLQYVEMQPGDGRYYGTDSYQLWASPHATGSTGSWFSIDYLVGMNEIFAQDAYKLPSDRGSLAISHERPGRVSAQLITTDGTLIVTTNGWNDDDVVRLVEAIDIDAQGRPTITDPLLSAGHELISTVEPWNRVQGSPREWVGYAQTLDPDRSVTITVSTPPDAIDSSVVPDRQVLLPFIIDHATSFTVDGHAAVAGALVEQPGFSMATWLAGDHIVTVTAALSVPELITIARTVHTVSQSEWDGMKFQAQHNSTEAGSGDYTETRPMPVSFGTDADGNVWTIQVSQAVYGGHPMFIWQLGSSGTGIDPVDGAEINTFIDGDRTYVLADLPRVLAATAELRIAVPGRDPVVVPFNDADATLDRTFAAFAFTEVGRFTAEIVAAEGTVLASWPPPIASP